MFYVEYKDPTLMDGFRWKFADKYIRPYWWRNGFDFLKFNSWSPNFSALKFKNADFTDFELTKDPRAMNRF